MWLEEVCFYFNLMKRSHFFFKSSKDEELFLLQLQAFKMLIFHVFLFPLWSSSLPSFLAINCFISKLNACP